jgi:rhodanese-related sulfurtransferase
MHSHAQFHPRILRAILASLLLGLAACTPSEAPSAGASSPARIIDGTLVDDGPVPEISTAELQAAPRDPASIVLDARAPEEYTVSHIPGAHNVPGKPGLSASQYTADANEIIRRYPDRSRRLVLYCNGPHCGRSKRLAGHLVKRGATVPRSQLLESVWGDVTESAEASLEVLVARIRRKLGAHAVLTRTSELTDDSLIADDELEVPPLVRLDIEYGRAVVARENLVPLRSERAFALPVVDLYRSNGKS